MKKIYIAAALWILVFSALAAYQNPVNYIDSVDAVQANLGNQKFSEWITANDADIDTLHNRADSLGLEVDTLRLRVDSIQVSRDSICFIYDAGGGQSIAASSDAYILIDTDVFKDGIYTHAADVCSISVSSPGRYEVSYSASFQITDNTKLVVVSYLLKKYSGSWSNVPGGGAVDGWLANSRSFCSVSKAVTCTLSVDDAIALHVTNSATETAISTVANTVTLSMKKLH